MLHVKCQAGTGRPWVGMDLFVHRELSVNRDTHWEPQPDRQTEGGELKEPD